MPCEVGEMNYEIYYLSRDNDGYREMDNKMALDDYTPDRDDWADLWEKQTEGSVEAESEEEALSNLWEAYNRSPSGYAAEMDDKEMRSMQKNDIVILNGTVYLCARMGWDEIGEGWGDDS